jgi:hypothetical protein
LDGTAAPAQPHGQAISLTALLVIVIVLGVLAAVGTAGVVTVVGAAPVERCASEVAAVQAAMDAMMADQGIVTVTAQATPGDRFTDLPAGSGTLPLAPRYLPLAPTMGRYTWDAAGTITQVSCP